MKKFRLLALAAVFLLFLAAIVYYLVLAPGERPDQAVVEAAPDIMAPEKMDDITEAVIGEGTTFIEVMKEAGTSYATALAIYEAARPVYDLVKIRAGNYLGLTWDKDTKELKSVKYRIDTEEELLVYFDCSAVSSQSEIASPTPSPPPSAVCGWQARVEPIPYEVKIRKTSGTVETSMYEAAEEAGIDIRAIIELANAFQWTIDFAMDPRKGDEFSFVYEERFLDGEYVMPGRIFAGRYINDGEPFEVYYFEESVENRGFFDSEGNSVQKMFLKAPVAFKYISSGFTTGLRYIEAFNISTGHRAIDYAAALGTPVRAVGDGTVTFAGWDGGYGQKISVRHNGTYTTNYCHLSRYAVKRGAKVAQGDVIGYVGSTGLSTGPHLHYEMVKDGVKINPLKEVLPPGEPIKAENRERFEAELAKWRERLSWAE